jgi:hypothetical protein
MRAIRKWHAETAPLLAGHPEIKALPWPASLLMILGLSLALWAGIWALVAGAVKLLGN